VYSEGDECLAEPGRRYQTHVKYQCDPDGHDELNDFPQLVSVVNYDASKSCVFDFVWKSRFACSPCQLD